MNEDSNVGFSIGKLFSQTFMPHKEDEVESYFSVGSLETTPDIHKVQTGCPTPWAFLRILLGTLVAYLLMYFSWTKFHNIHDIPGLIFTGCIFVPLGLVMFFFEMNITKNISIYQILKLLIIGGALSLLYTEVFCLLDKITQLNLASGASGAAFIEEPAKFLVLFFFINKKRYPYILNGLLLGAAVGAGFAIYESAGYALRVALTQDNGTVAMVHTILLRGVLSVFGHIIWTAIAGGALWMVKGLGEFRASMLLYLRFLAPFFCAIGLHYAWNSNWQVKLVTPVDKYIILGVIGWALIVFLLRKGLQQVEEAKQLAVSYVPNSYKNEESDVVSPTQIPEAPANVYPNAARPAPAAFRPATPVATPAPVATPTPAPTPAQAPEFTPNLPPLPNYIDNNDPLNLAEQKRKSKEREENREPPDHSGQSWRRYYGK